MCIVVSVWMGTGFKSPLSPVRRHRARWVRVLRGGEGLVHPDLLWCCCFQLREAESGLLIGPRGSAPLGTGWGGRPRGVGEGGGRVIPPGHVFLSWHLQKVGVLCVCVCVCANIWKQNERKACFQGISTQFQPGAPSRFTEVVGIWKRALGTGHNFNPWL